MFSQPDLFVAATAAEDALVAVSRDTTHFIAAGVATLDPWSGAFVDAGGVAAAMSAHLGDSELLTCLRRVGPA